MSEPGPVLESLLRRLSECPPEFCETCTAAHGGAQVAAIMADHGRAYGHQFLTTDRRQWLKQLGQPVRAYKQKVRYWGLLSVTTWLLHDEWFLARPNLADLGWEWQTGERLQQLAELVRPELFTSDPDRREELARLCLAAHQLEPANETVLQARDRLQTLDSVERQRILAATAAAERRAREVREAMARKQALESASRYGE
jgi:hypothetical protein